MCLSEEISRLVLVHDPSGSFPRDHWFYRMAWVETLENGYWPEGSIWRAEVSNGGGNFYVVVRGEPLEPQRAVQYKGKVKRIGHDKPRDIKQNFYGDPDAFTPRRSRSGGRPSKSFS